MGRFSFEMLWKAFHNISIFTLAIRRHLLCQRFDVHASAFHILNGRDFKTIVTAEDHMPRSNGQTRDNSKPEQVRRLGKGGAVDPFLRTVPPFPICEHRCYDFIGLRRESFHVFRYDFSCNRDQRVHPAKAHMPTFQSRSRRSSVFTTSHV